MGKMGRGLRSVVALAVLGALLSSCTLVDIVKLAGNDTAGRDNATPGSALARAYLLQELKPIARGADQSRSGDDAYLQAIPNGTNVVAVIPGTDLADQYVLVGAHYDHLGRSCRTADPQDTICNGATDNAAGAAAVLSIARSIAQQPTRPRRSVIFALWDREEDGLVGSLYYAQHPIVPLANTVAYVNFDIQGANLLPSLRNTTFAIASESGGPNLQAVVRSAIAEQTLDSTMLSSIFGQGRSDYASFLNVQVPSVFFSDATGPCYHTAQDGVGVVDFAKLDQEIAIALRVVRDLATTNTPPTFVADAPVATFDDALALVRVVNRLWVDRNRFVGADLTTMTRARTEVTQVVTDGRAAFDSADVTTVLRDAAGAVRVFTHGVCDGFLVPS